MRLSRYLPAILFLLPACVDVDADLSADTEAGSDDDVPEITDRAAGDHPLCTRREHIAIRTSSGCPNIGNWQGSGVFDEGTPWLAADAGPVPTPMGRFCRYEWPLVADPTNTQLSNLYSNPGIEEIAPSCNVVDGAADVLTSAVGPDLRDIFHDDVGRVPKGDLFPSGSTFPDLRVTVAVVDTAPADPLAESNSPHGRYMGEVIEDLACPDGQTDCGVEVEYVIGLPRTAILERDYAHGGYVGTHADLAAGIYEATRRWEVANAARTEPTDLILNISGGWEQETVDLIPQDMAANIKSVRTAIEHASCAGAQIIAAAGNESRFCGAQGPIFPAAWEQLPAPGSVRCQQLGYAGASPGTGAGYRPLVNAVGGLGLKFDEMPGARPGAGPRLWAMASHVVPSDPPEVAITGTSVATAIASATSALVWTRRPDLDAAGVMDLVHDGGVDLTPAPAVDFQLPGAAQIPQRIDTCRALTKACYEENSCVPMTLDCLGSNELPAPIGGLAALVDAIPADSDVDVPFAAVGQCQDACGVSFDVETPAGVAPSCDALVPDVLDLFVNPTPDSIGCSTCGVEVSPNEIVAVLTVDQEFASVAIDAAVVVLTDPNGGLWRYELGSLSLTPSIYARRNLNEQKVELPPAVARAKIIYTFATGEVTEDTMWINSPVN